MSWWMVGSVAMVKSLLFLTSHWVLCVRYEHVPRGKRDVYINFYWEERKKGGWLFLSDRSGGGQSERVAGKWPTESRRRGASSSIHNTKEREEGSPLSIVEREKKKPGKRGVVSLYTSHTSVHGREARYLAYCHVSWLLWNVDGDQ